MGSLKKYVDVVQPFGQLYRTLIYVNMDKYIYTRLSERFAPVFDFNSEQFRFVYKIKKITKKPRILKYLFVDFQNFMKIEFWLWKIFEILIIHKSFPGVKLGPTQHLDPISLAVLTLLDSTYIYIHI